MDPRTYMKAIAGGLTAGLGVLFLALADNVVTGQEWVGIAQAALVTVCAVYQIPNTLGVIPLGKGYIPEGPAVTPAVIPPNAVIGDPNSR